MNSSSPKYEGWLYALAFLIAVALRFIQLGAAPLTDSEATLALQAFHLASGKSILLAPQPAYILFTSIFFAVVEGTNFMARILPAIAGSMFIFAPLVLREKIKPRPAVILALLIAVDPGLTALSRQSNGTILAVTFLMFAYGMWTNRRRITAAGIFLALALLSGPSIWSGLLILLLTLIFLRFTEPAQSTPDEAVSASTETLRSQIISILPSFILTLLIAGTLFFTTPNGLSAAFASIPAYFNDWIHPSTVSPARVLIVFLAYEPLGITLAILSLIRGFRTNSKRITRLSMWLGVALLLAVFQRNTNELAWAILPLLMLAAMELSRALDLFRDELLEVGLVTFGITLLAAYIWYNVSGIALNAYTETTTFPILGTVQNPRLLVLYGSMLILIMSLLLVGSGWSARTARLSATWAAVIFFGFYSIAAAWGASGLRDSGGFELWLPDTRPVQSDLLNSSVNEISDYSVGHIDSQPVTIFGVSSPALEWLLRNDDVTVVSTLDPQVAPPILVTSVMQDPGLPAAYRGQDFIWRQFPQWESVKTYEWIKWLVFRQLPEQDETIILWARNDLFPDGQAKTP